MLAATASVALGLIAFLRWDFPFRTRALVWSMLAATSFILAPMGRAGWLLAGGMIQIGFLALGAVGEGAIRAIRALAFRQNQQWFSAMKTILVAQDLALYRVPKRRAMAIWMDVSSNHKADLEQQLRVLRTYPLGKEHAEAKIETLTERIVEEQKLILTRAFANHIQFDVFHRFLFRLTPFHPVSKVVVKTVDEKVTIIVGLELLSLEKTIGRRIHLSDMLPRLLDDYKFEIAQATAKAERELASLLDYT